MNQYNQNGTKKGYWEFYYENGNLLCKGNYINGNRGGCWEWYYPNGELKLNEYYIYESVQ